MNPPEYRGGVASDEYSGARLFELPTFTTGREAHHVRQVECSKRLVKLRIALPYKGFHVVDNRRERIRNKQERGAGPKGLSLLRADVELAFNVPERHREQVPNRQGLRHRST